MTKIHWLTLTVLFSDTKTDKLNEELALNIESKDEGCEILIELNSIVSFNSQDKQGITTLRTYSGEYKVDMEYKLFKQYILDETEHFNSKYTK